MELVRVGCGRFRVVAAVDLLCLVFCCCKLAASRGSGREGRRAGCGCFRVVAAVDLLCLVFCCCKLAASRGPGREVVEVMSKWVDCVVDGAIDVDSLFSCCCCCWVSGSLFVVVWVDGSVGVVGGVIGIESLFVFCCVCDSRCMLVLVRWVGGVVGGDTVIGCVFVFC